MWRCDPLPDVGSGSSPVYPAPSRNFRFTPDTCLEAGVPNWAGTCCQVQTSTIYQLIVDLRPPPVISTLEALDVMRSQQTMAGAARRRPAPTAFDTPRQWPRLARYAGPAQIMTGARSYPGKAHNGAL